jgi:cell division cycle protein 37
VIQDALELSDDSDIEVHPNVDKKSFIRAKQAQIHQQRAQRKHHISTLKYERIVNDGMIERIDRLLTALKSHKTSSQSADELIFQSLIESAGDSKEDQPPPPPEGVHQNVKEQPVYSKMMASLVDQVRREVGDQGKSGDEFELYVKGITGHRTKIEGLQQELNAKLVELEAEEKRYITSDDLHEGFDYSNVSCLTPSHFKHSANEQQVQKDVAPPPASVGKSRATSSAGPELLNPSRPALHSVDSAQSAGADGDIEDGPDPDLAGDSDDENISASKDAKQFAKIAVGDYRSSLDFLSKHQSLLSERESDGLLVEAFDAQLENKPKYARQCVHQALLIQYCRQLGKDGVGLFFKRITTPGHQANKLFTDDVNTTYSKIRDRAAQIAKEREDEDLRGGEEQIQLHAVDPSTEISITVPPPIPVNLKENNPLPPPTEEQIEARRLFESFPPGLQRALESGSLDEVNKVLGKMSVSEAEEVVEKLGAGGMLNLEEKVIDATTEEGKRVVEEIERTHRLPNDDGGPGPKLIEVEDVPSAQTQSLKLEDTVD